MDSKRRMAFVFIELAQRFDEPTLITTTELQKRLEEFGRETQRPISVGRYRFGRRRRLTRPVLRGTRPASRSSSVASCTLPAFTSASALLKEARASGVYAQRSSSGTTVARRKLIALSTTLTSSCEPVRIPRRRRISAGRVSRPCSFTATRVLDIDLTLPAPRHFVNVTLRPKRSHLSCGWKEALRPGQRARRRRAETFRKCVLPRARADPGQAARA